MDHSQFRTEAARAVHRFNEWARRFRPNVAFADHLCYKCGSRAEFERLRTAFEKESNFIYQSEISGRSIALVAFRDPWRTHFGEMRLLELSDQKPDGNQRSGFDHIELYPASGAAHTLALTLDSPSVRFVESGRAHHRTWDAVIFDTFEVRIEEEPLLRTVTRDEISRAFT